VFPVHAYRSDTLAFSKVVKLTIELEILHAKLPGVFGWLEAKLPPPFFFIYIYIKTEGRQKPGMILSQQTLVA